MSKKCKWEVRFSNGQTVSVDASCKRMACANGSVEAHQLPSEIVSYRKQWRGRARNGNRAWRENRYAPYPKGHHESLRNPRRWA